MNHPHDMRWDYSALAASYDRIARFDRACAQAISLAGETAEIVIILGYSYMLRGALLNPRNKFMQAYEREPNNPTILNNLQLLNSSVGSIKDNPNLAPFSELDSPWLIGPPSTIQPRKSMCEAGDVLAVNSVSTAMELARLKHVAGIGKFRVELQGC